MRNKGAIDTSCELGEWFRKVEKIRSTGGTVERERESWILLCQCDRAAPVAALWVLRVRSPHVHIIMGTTAYVFVCSHARLCTLPG